MVLLRLLQGHLPARATAPLSKPALPSGPCWELSTTGREQRPALGTGPPGWAPLHLMRACAEPGTWEVRVYSSYSWSYSRLLSWYCWW